MSRLALRGAALLAAALVVTSCGNSSGDDTSSSGGSGGSPGGSAGSAFPVTVDTAFGAIKVDEQPERVVALGWSDAETALSLGVQPVGASDWLGFGGEGVGPWAKGLYKTAPKIIATTEPSFEEIAALKPDLILDTRSDATQARYEQLSKIAPTIGQPKGVGAYQTSWQQQLELVGKALGRSDQAGTLESDTEKAFADAKAAHPEFTGRTVAVGADTSAGFGAYVRGDSRVDFMEQLGFTNKKEIQDLATPSFYVSVSNEQLPLFDADLTVMFPIFIKADVITGNPLWQAIPSVQRGHAVVLEDQTLVNAFSSGDALGIRYALDQAVPQFATAVSK